MAELKIKFRDELEKFADKHFGQKLGRLNDKQRSDALTLCYLLEIRNALLPGSVPDDIEELQGFLCDGSDDRTVDFLYRDDDKHVTVIQSKQRSPDKNESEPDFDSFRSCLRKICPATRGSTRINQKLLDISADIDWETDNFTLIYLSLARHSTKIAEAADQDVEDIPNSPLSDISSRTEVRYLSEDEINKEWRDVLHQKGGSNPSVDLLLASTRDDPPNSAAYMVVENTSGVKSYIALLSAAQIHNLYVHHRDKLFNLNIRNYIGDTRTNKDIIKTATTDGDNFFFYNNGISAVASKVNVDIDDAGHTKLNCTDFSIINGAQTFRSISKAHTRNRESAGTKNLKVLMRISEFDFRKPHAADMLDNITRYNNTQNSMRVSDFRSNDSVQTSLVKYVSQVAAFGGKHYLYRNKRTQGAERNKISIKMDDFCRAIYAYQFGPADFFGGLSHLYDTGTDGGYVKLFGKELEALSQAEFDRLFGIWLITAHVAELLKEHKKADSEKEDEADVVRKNALERKYLAFYALAEVMSEVCRLKKIDEADFLRTLSKPKWQDDKNRVKFVNEAFDVACDMVVQAYQIAQNKPNFVHRNFFRDSDTLTVIKGAKASRKGELRRLSESKF
jgi:hypothetical protein